MFTWNETHIVSHVAIVCAQLQEFGQPPADIIKELAPGMALHVCALVSMCVYECVCMDNVWMYACMCFYVHACMCVCMYVRMYVCMHVCM